MVIPRNPPNTPRATPTPKRGEWGSRAEFILSCIGMSVGFGTVWRFPYLVYKNGGAVFLIPYVSFIFLVGRPIYFLELAVGQFTSQSALTLWKCCPIAKGIGWGQQIICYICCVYYNVIIAYIIFYTMASFRSVLPWKNCEEWWGADTQCYTRKPDDPPVCSNEDLQRSASNSTSIKCVVLNYTRQTAAEQFWKRYVLHMHESEGLHDLGIIRWELALCLVLAWIFVFVCLIKGIKSSGKVVYVTAVFPYVILIILIIRGVTLDGSTAGLKFLFIPDWSKLLQLSLWRDSAEQVFFSLGISWGILTMYGSYNRFNHKVYLDAYLIVCVDLGTSILGCIAIFSVLGHMSKTLQVKIENVVEAGPGLTFIVYPEALTLLPFAPFWSVIFFIMLFTLGVDSEFGMVESFLTNACDEWPLLRKWRSLTLMTACLSCLLFGLPLVTNGGQYIFHLMDSYGAAASLIIVGFFEMTSLMWIYGGKRLMRDFEFMLDIRFKCITWVSWALICPAFLFIIFIVGCISEEAPKYGNYVYDTGGQFLAYFLMALSVVQIPIWAIYYVIKYWRRKELRQVFRPTEDWGPQDPEIKAAWKEATQQPSQTVESRESEANMTF